MDKNKARVLAAIAIFIAAAYVAQSVLTPIVWSCLIAISAWPLRERLRRFRYAGPTGSAALLTLAAVLLLLMPIVYLTYHGFRELPSLLRVWAESKDSGLPAPDWLGSLPLLGPWALKTWNTLIAEPGALSAFVHGLAQKLRFSAGRTFVTEMGHRAMSLFFCVLALFFLFRDGDRLAAQVRVVTRRLLG
ncbi:MAG: AI-2E family transporter, partial [Caldimonas sp.]